MSAIPQPSNVVREVLIALSACSVSRWCPMKQHILVVDDEAPIRDLLQTYFKKHQYGITTVATAREAIRVASEVSLNLIILDVILAESDGLDLLQALKESHPNLPVIVMTGIGFDEDLLQEAMRKGASGFISKTLQLDQLLMEVHRVLDYR